VRYRITYRFSYDEAGNKQYSHQMGVDAADAGERFARMWDAVGETITILDIVEDAAGPDANAIAEKIVDRVEEVLEATYTLPPTPSREDRVRAAFAAIGNPMTPPKAPSPQLEELWKQVMQWMHAKTYPAGGRLGARD
jgi:hypothetical protein